MRLCKKKDLSNVFSYLKKNASLNCFFIGDLENHGLEDEFIDVWLSEKDDEVSAVVLRYYKYYIVSAISNIHCKEIVEIISNDKDCISVSGDQKILEECIKFINFSESSVKYLAELNASNFNYYEPEVRVVKASKIDISELFEFLKSIDEFNITDKNKETFGKEIINNSGRIYFIRENSKIVSTATISAENSLNGMIISVATDKDYRKKGYALACVTEICKSMVDDNKKVVLFYDNPNAGAMYKKIGFKDIANWLIANK